jgi:hypothetical protein
MNKFNLDQLRNDVIDHTDLFHTAIIDGTPFWRDQWTDWILIQLIGSDYYDVMHRNPLTTIRFDFRGSHQVLNMDAYSVNTTITG